MTSTVTLNVERLTMTITSVGARYYELEQTESGSKQCSDLRSLEDQLSVLFTQSDRFALAVIED